MTNIARSTIASLLSAFLLLIGIAPAGAVPTSDDDFNTLMAAATNGDPSGLAELLAGESSAATQEQLKSWLVERGDFAWEAQVQSELGSVTSGTKTDKGSVSTAAKKPAISKCDGYYNCTCKGYNGVSLNWYGKVILACHGWYDAYISGKHVAHFNPDLIPRGSPVSIGCAYAIGSAVLSAGSIGTVGWATYGIGLLVNSGGVVISCP